LKIGVASISFIIYLRAGHLRCDLLLPFMLTSIPAAIVGGSLKFRNQPYSIFLYALLTFVAIRLLFFSNKRDEMQEDKVRKSVRVTIMLMTRPYDCL
jgi:uncharacterized membrane protein YfcA